MYHLGAYLSVEGEGVLLQNITSQGGEGDFMETFRLSIIDAMYLEPLQCRVVVDL